MAILFLGPGNCLGMLAAKSGPTAIRGQYYGMAAAIGKIGAFVGTWAFPAMIDGPYIKYRLIPNLFDANLSVSLHSFRWFQIKQGQHWSLLGRFGPCDLLCADHVLLHSPAFCGRDDDGGR